MKNTIIIAIAALLMACSDNGPGNQEASSTQSKLAVVTSNYPLYFFTSEIAGDKIDLHFPSIAGDPAMWAPAGEDAARLQQADLLILNGAGYESWLAFTTLQSDHILDTTAHLQDKLLPVESTTVHQHGPQGEHSHQGTAFTTWLDPTLAIEQARAIKQRLSRLDPQQSELFQANFESLESRLTRLDLSLAQAFSSLGNQPLTFSHPVYQYLQHRYDINGRSVHWEPDTEPGTKDWIDLGRMLRQHPAKLMLWEASPLESVRVKLQKMGVYSVVFSPAGNQLDKGDYFAIMQANLLQLAEFGADTDPTLRVDSE